MLLANVPLQNRRQPVAVDDGSPIDTSFPGFAALMNSLGAKIEAA